MTNIWGNFTNSSVEYAVQAFQAVDPWFYPIIFIGIIGYLYTCMHSVTVAIVGIIITFGMFAVTTNIFAEVPEITQFLYLVAITGITVLIVTLITKRRITM